MANEDSIDTAAQAFLNDMGGSKAGKSSGGASDGPTEELFGDQEMEDDDGSDPGNEEEENDEGDEDVPSGGEDGDEADEEGDGEGDDEDGEDDDEGEDEGDETPPGSLDLEAEVTLTVDGEEVKVPLKEALSGYIRTETFQRRLNILNEAKGEILREQGETAQAREKYIAGLEALQSQLEEITPREPTQAEWDAMYAEDPANARKQELAWKNYKDQKAALKGAAEKARAEQAEQHKINMVNWVRGEQVKIMRAIPQWNDEKTRVRELDSMKRTAKSVGYSDEEIATLYDSRAVLVLRKAAAYDRLMAKKPKEVKKLVRQPNASGSGRPSGQTGRKDGGRAMENLRKTGSLDAAASVFGGILSDEQRSRRKR